MTDREFMISNNTNSPPLPGSPTVRPFRIWVADCPFRRNGSPVLGTMGSSVRTIIVIEDETWRRLCAEVPQLAATHFEVGTFE